MAKIRIEMDRGRGWEVRGEGDDPSATVERVIASLPAYAHNYPHRAFFDGVLVGTVEQPKGLRSKVVLPAC